VDTESQAVLDVHCSTNWEESDADLAEQIARRNVGDLRSLAADNGYDKQSLREGLCDLGIRPLIKHLIIDPYDYAYNTRVNNSRYNQRSMTEPVNLTVKRSEFREFCKTTLMCIIYYIKHFVNQ
jgi:IS5 family transposase